MGLFEMLEFYLKDFYETILAYAKARLLLVSKKLVGQKDSVSGNNGPLILTLINILGDKVAWWKNLIYSGCDLIVGGKNLKIG